MTAPEGWGVWSNGAGERDADGVWRFAETEPISTYITCVVAGPYHYVTDDYRRTLPDGSELRIPLGAMCRKGLAPHFDADDIFLVTKQGLDFFHDHFGYPYPFGKYDQAFVPEYNLGAMENPGMVTFREEYIYRGKVTAASYERRATTILHEMAHMWFGDLVTMKWWDDLWLKESFADFMGSFALVEATRFTNGWTTFANNRKAWAYRADQLPSTHPITADIRDLQDAKLNFDGITYAKGASVLKQLVAYVGRDAFLEGARRYFQRHAFGNTTLADLLAVLEETSGRDLMRLVEGMAPDGGRQRAHPRTHPGRREPDHRTGRRPGGRRLPPGAAPAPGRRRPLPAGRRRGRAGAVRPRRAGRDRAAHRRHRAGRPPRRLTWSSSTTTTSRTARCGSTRTRWPRSGPGSATSPTRWPARSAGRRCGT